MTWRCGPSATAGSWESSKRHGSFSSDGCVNRVYSAEGFHCHSRLWTFFLVKSESTVRAAEVVLLPNLSRAME